MKQEIEMLQSTSPIRILKSLDFDYFHVLDFIPKHKPCLTLLCAPQG